MMADTHYTVKLRMADTLYSQTLDCSGYCSSFYQQVVLNFKVREAFGNCLRLELLKVLHFHTGSFERGGYNPPPLPLGPLKSV